ncbi:MAG TPA: hypothetical protein VK395_03545 [Gemmataceae bacterium]|nr:hypothetical protein [Gemmataceae bacterium]
MPRETRPKAPKRFIILEMEKDRWWARLFAIVFLIIGIAALGASAWLLSLAFTLPRAREQISLGSGGLVSGLGMLGLFRASLKCHAKSSQHTVIIANLISARELKNKVTIIDYTELCVKLVRQQSCDEFFKKLRNDAGRKTKSP